MRDGLEPVRALPQVAGIRVLGGVGAVELRTGAGYLDRRGPQLAVEFLRRDLLLRAPRRRDLFHAALRHH